MKKNSNKKCRPNQVRIREVIPTISDLVESLMKDGRYGQAGFIAEYDLVPKKRLRKACVGTVRELEKEIEKLEQVIIKVNLKKQKSDFLTQIAEFKENGQ